MHQQSAAGPLFWRCQQINLPRATSAVQQPGAAALLAASPPSRLAQTRCRHRRAAPPAGCQGWRWGLTTARLPPAAGPPVAARGRPHPANDCRQAAALGMGVCAWGQGQTPDGWQWRGAASLGKVVQLQLYTAVTLEAALMSASVAIAGCPFSAWSGLCVVSGEEDCRRERCARAQAGARVAA